MINNKMPDYWIELTIGDTADYLNGRAFKPSEWEVKGLPIIRIQNLNNSRASFNYTYGEFKQCYKIDNGDLLFSWSASLGVYIWNGGEAWLNQHIFKVIPHEYVVKKYLYYYLQNTIAEFYNKTHGSGMVHITKKKFEATPFLLPPFPEQRAIVSKIEQLFSDLDNGIDNFKEAQEQLKIYRQAVLKAACGGKLVPTEAELARAEGRDYEPADVLLARILEERREKWNGKGKFKEPAAPDTNVLPELPEGWVWATAQTLSTFESESICAGPFGTIFKAKDFRPFGVPIIFLRHVGPCRYLTHKPTFMDKTKWNELFKQYSVYGGELLITKLGEPPGICAIYPHGIGPAMVTPDVMKMSVNEEVASPRFLMYYFNSEISRRFASGSAFGTTRLRITLPIFRNMPIPLPPITEQNQIVQEIETRLSICDKLEVTVAESLEKAESLRQSILKKAFEGKLLNEKELEEARNALDWEPAEKLLERIKAQKNKYEIME